MFTFENAGIEGANKVDGQFLCLPYLLDMVIRQNITQCGKFRDSKEEIRTQDKLRKNGVLVFQGHHNKTPQTEWLKIQKIIFS